MFFELIMYFLWLVFCKSLEPNGVFYIGIRIPMFVISMFVMILSSRSVMNTEKPQQLKNLSFMFHKS
jgi:hypothetical protein